MFRPISSLRKNTNSARLQALQELYAVFEKKKKNSVVFIKASMQENLCCHLSSLLRLIGIELIKFCIFLFSPVPVHKSSLTKVCITRNKVRSFR